MEKEELRIRLKRALEMRDKKSVDLSRDLNIPKSAVSQYLSGKSKNMTADRLYDIARYLHVSEAWLMGYDVPMERDLKPLPSNVQLYVPEIRTLPVLGRVACGEPIMAAEDQEYVTIENAPKDVDFILIAKGDSMTGARINDGDYVFIKKQSTVENGEIAAVLIGDEATLKRVYFDQEAGVLTLVAENPAYAPLVYSGDKLADVRIIGKAIIFQSVVR